ncbi:MAG: biopolymer transporter ExbD [Candidatus Zixiibacteriota bacterium]|nr:MAG: biopolymer transporter ExbD [candidate division Zixibacteria bacterium]
MAFAPSKGKKHRRPAAAMPQLTSMMDMMVIMLLFLLKVYSTSGALIKPADGVDLPSSTVAAEPVKVLSLLATRNGLYEEINAQQHRLIEDLAALQDDNQVELGNLSSFLHQVQDRNRRFGREETRTLTIQGDKTIPYRWVLKIINTCSNAGFEKIDFVVLKESKHRG